MTFTHGISDGPGWIDTIDESNNFYCKSFSKYDTQKHIDFGLVRYYHNDESTSYVSRKGYDTKPTPGWLYKIGYN